MNSETVKQNCIYNVMITESHVFDRDGDYLEVHGSSGWLKKYSRTLTTASCTGEHKFTIGYRPSQYFPTNQ